MELDNHPGTRLDTGGIKNQRRRNPVYRGVPPEAPVDRVNDKYLVMSSFA